MKQTKKQHCPEVEELLYGKTPFITRHGITVVLIVIILALFFIMQLNSNTEFFFINTMEKITNQVKSII